MNKLNKLSEHMGTLYQTSRRIKDMVASERPQERLAKHGAKALSDSEILAMILRSGPRGIDVLTMSSDLLTAAGSLTHLLRWTAADFQKIKGIGTVKSLQLMAVMDFARRILQQDDSVETIFDTPEVVANHFRTLIAGAEVEHFWTLCLDRKKSLNSTHRGHRGNGVFVSRAPQRSIQGSDPPERIGHPRRSQPP